MASQYGHFICVGHLRQCDVCNELLLQIRKNNKRATSAGIKALQASGFGYKTEIVRVGECNLIFHST